MWFHSPPVPRRSAPRTRLALEPLEARDVPALYTPANAAELIADMNAANASPEADVISLSAGATYTLTTAISTDHGDVGLPTVPKTKTGGKLTIRGNGATIERSSAAPAFRLLDVAKNADLTLDHVTLQGGNVTGNGGAIYSLGVLGMSDCVVQNNVATNTLVEGRITGADAKGGGIYVGGGSTALTRVTLHDNIARGGDGRYGIASTSDRGGSEPPGPGGAGGDGFGGGIYIAAGSVTLDAVTVSGNDALGGDGGVGGHASAKYTGGKGGKGGNGYGGGIYVAGGTLTLLNTSVTSNRATGGVGGIGGNAGTNKEGRPGKDGQGIGGGIYVDADVTYVPDTFTKRHVTGNTASTSNPDTFGI